MPSWNEKPHVTPTININLKPCSCGFEVSQRNAARGHGSFPVRHMDDCDAAPILIPCPIPRSATFTVRLGMCTCADHPEPGDEPPHLSGCPALPIRVSCSISGKTWEANEVTDIDDSMIKSDYEDETTWGEAAHQGIRDRWALVKALVLGYTDLSALLTGPKALELLARRDAVFAALADMARSEKAMLTAQERVVEAIGSTRLTTGAADPTYRPSSQALAVYVEHLIEQVGVLEVLP